MTEKKAIDSSIFDFYIYYDLLWSKEIKISWLGSFCALSNQTATVICTNNCEIKKLMTKLANQTLCEKCRSFFGSK